MVSSYAPVSSYQRALFRSAPSTSSSGRPGISRATAPGYVARARQRCENRGVQPVELGLFGKTQDVRHDRVHVLRVDAEDERSDDADAVAVEALEVLAVVIDAAPLRRAVFPDEGQRFG